MLNIYIFNYLLFFKQLKREIPRTILLLSKFRNIFQTSLSQNIEKNLVLCIFEHRNFRNNFLMLTKKNIHIHNYMVTTQRNVPHYAIRPLLTKFILMYLLTILCSKQRNKRSYYGLEDGWRGF